MKKLFLILFLAFGSQCVAQFIQGYGLMGGGTLARQKWKFYEPANDVIKQKWKLGWNVSGFVEYINHKYIRGISEIEYNRKGCIERFPIPDQRHKENFLTWNNYLKLRQELYDVTPYFLIGPRVEYLLSSTGTTFNKLNFSWSFGPGIEILKFDPWVIMFDYQYNPPIANAFKGPGYYPAGTGTSINGTTVFFATNPDLRIRDRAHQLRVGIKWVIHKTGYCPPVFTMN